MREVTNITSDELWAYMATHREDEYVLVDVRELEEYEAGHIPGAKPYPLSDFDVRIPELVRLKGKDLVFYCRSGGRSRRAATLAAQGLGMSGVHNLIGGILAWQNEVVTVPPTLYALDPSAGTGELLARALGLEKGAHELYALLGARFGAGLLGEAARELAGDELGHARAIHRMMAGERSTDAAFQEAFERADARLAENGEPLPAIVERMSRAGARGLAALLELALEVELSAYDLYKNLATQTAGLTREVLFDLAQHEKWHVAAVARRLARSARGAPP